MKILFLASSFPRFEGDTSAPFILSIAQALKKRGHAVRVIAPFHPSCRDSRVGAVDVDWFRYVFPARWSVMGHGQSLVDDGHLRPAVLFLAPLYFLTSLVSLLRAAQKTGCDLLYCHWVIPNGPAAALASMLLGKTLLISLHGSDIFMAGKNKILGWMARVVFQRAEAVTACSPDMLPPVKRLGAGAKTRLLAWGADPERFSPDVRSAPFRESCGWKAEDVIIGAAGRLVSKKGFDILLQAFGRIATEFPRARVVLAGDGPLRARLAKRAAALGVADRVEFAGRIAWAEIPVWFAAFDLFVLPSVQDTRGNVDGLPTVLLEALSSGVPAIASRLAGIPLVITNNENGLLVEPGDVHQLSDALRRLLSSPGERHRMGVQARVDLLRNHTWDSVAEKIENLVQSGR